MDNEIIKLKKDVTLRQLTDVMWVTVDEWRSVRNKQTFVNELSKQIRQVIEEKGGGENETRVF